MSVKRPLLLLTEPDFFSAREQVSKFTRLRAGPFTRRELLKQVTQAQILWVRLAHRIDQEVLDAAPQLRCIVSPTTGLNHIDQAACARRGITVLSLRNELKFLRSITSTAEHTLGLILALLRQTVPAHQSVCRGIWDRTLFMGRQASNLTLGIIGLGRLGRIVCRLALPMFERVLACDPFVTRPPAGVQKVSIDRLLALSDVITIHVHSSSDTYHLMNSSVFRKMKRGAYLVNTSRGDMIDEKALLNALCTDKLSGAALDVLEAEHQDGFTPQSQMLVRYAKSHANLILTPHIGGATKEALPAAEMHMALKLRRAWTHAAL